MAWVRMGLCPLGQVQAPQGNSSLPFFTLRDLEETQVMQGHVETQDSRAPRYTLWSKGRRGIRAMWEPTEAAPEQRWPGLWAPGSQAAFPSPWTLTCPLTVHGAAPHRWPDC